MPNEIQPFTVPDMQAMAESVAKSRLFGLDAAQAFTLMLLAQSEGIHPIKCVQRYHVIHSRPSMKTDAMLADFQRLGGTVKWLTASNNIIECEAVFTHPIHAPEGQLARFDMEDAKRAGLAGGDIWKKYPAAMMRARVISLGIRMVCPGIVAGLYSEEEVRDFGPTIEVEGREVPQVPEHHAANHDNATGHGSGAYAQPDDVKAYQEFIANEVAAVNQKWCDRLTSPPDGEILTEAEAEVTKTWELSGHLLKWSKAKGWVNAPQDVRPSQRDKFAAVAWKDHTDEFAEETYRYFHKKWNEKLRDAKAKAAKAAKAQGKRDNPELEGIRAEAEVMDRMLETTEAGDAGIVGEISETLGGCHAEDSTDR